MASCLAAPSPRRKVECELKKCCLHLFAVRAETWTTNKLANSLDVQTSSDTQVALESPIPRQRPPGPGWVDGLFLKKETSPHLVSVSTPSPHCERSAEFCSPQPAHFVLVTLSPFWMTVDYSPSLNTEGVVGNPTRWQPVFLFELEG